MSDTKDRGIGVTIKAGKEYDKTWFHFQGNTSDIKADLQEFFGLDDEDIVGLTGYEVAALGEKIAQGLITVVSTLPVKSITVQPTENNAPTSTADEAQNSTQDDPWAGADEPAAPAENPLVAQVNGATSINDLKSLYAKNAAAFTADPELLALWKARGKAISAA